MAVGIPNELVFLRVFLQEEIQGEKIGHSLARILYVEPLEENGVRVLLYFLGFKHPHQVHRETLLQKCRVFDVDRNPLLFRTRNLQAQRTLPEVLDGLKLRMLKVSVFQLHD